MLKFGVYWAYIPEKIHTSLGKFLIAVSCSILARLTPKLGNFLKLGLLFNIRVRVGYELAIIISYSTSLSGIIFFY